jgi:hypothetical protein
MAANGLPEAPWLVPVGRWKDHGEETPGGFRTTISYGPTATGMLLAVVVGRFCHDVSMFCDDLEERW